MSGFRLSRLSRAMEDTIPDPPDLSLNPYINVEKGGRNSAQLQRERDDDELVRIGKRPVLRRNFGLLSMLGFSCTVMTTWEGILLLFQVNFANGGYAGSFYGAIIVWLGTAASFATMGELASMAPTAGGQYHWVSILAPKRATKFLSYLIGWLTVMGWQSIVASGGFLVAELTQSLMVMNNASYIPQQWQLMLLYWADIVFSIFINTIISPYLPQVEGFTLILHVFGFFGILLPLVYYGPHGSAETVFTVFLNEGEFPSVGLSFLIGLVGPAFTFLGADGAVHMSEEISNPAKNVPRAMIFSIALNGTLGLGILVATLFCLGDPQNVLHPKTNYAFIDIFLAAVGSPGGALTMAAVITIMSAAATISFVATASRMTFAFARDRGIPCWQYLSLVEPHTTLPLFSIAVTAIIAILLSIISIGSTVAFNDVVSLSISALYTSYLIGNSLLLYNRIKGQVRPYTAGSDLLTNTSGAEQLSWGPWRIPEPWGTLVNAFGCMYMLVVVFFTFWPTAMDPGVSGMNFSVVMMGTVMIFALIYYAIKARSIYEGPIVEVNITK